MQSYDFVPPPLHGRVFDAPPGKVRLGDATRGGRLRLDALVRYLQDAATDDADQALGLPDDGAPRAWIVRRLALEVGELPRYREPFVIRTWCSGIGPRWAERRSDLLVDGKVRVQAAAIWVHIDTITGRPVALPVGFEAVYGEAAGDREASQRLRLPGPSSSATASGAAPVPWPVRATDFDVLGHVNNAAYLHALEEVLAARTSRHARIHQVEVEWRAGIELGDRLELAAADTGPELRVWLLADNEVRAALFAGLRH